MLFFLIYKFLLKVKQAKVISLVFLGIMFSSCTNTDNFKIGMMLPNLESERYPKDRDYFISKVKELGGEVITTDAKENDKLQIKQATELLSQGIKVLVVVPVNKNTAALIVREAHKKNVKVIAYERIISNCKLDFYVSFNNIKIGELMASYAVKMKPQGNYVLLGGDKGDQNAIWVRQGQHNIIDPFIRSGKIDATFDVFIENWSMEEAIQKMTTYINLSGNIPDVILSAYDGISSGAITAIDNNIEINHYPVITGQNAELMACRNIIKGKQSMTIYKPILKEAQAAAVLAMKCVKKEKITGINSTINNGFIDVPAILIEPIEIDKSNMKKILVSDGFIKNSEFESFL